MVGCLVVTPQHIYGFNFRRGRVSLGEERGQVHTLTMRDACMSGGRKILRECGLEVGREGGKEANRGDKKCELGEKKVRR